MFWIASWGASVSQEHTVRFGGHKQDLVALHIKDVPEEGVLTLQLT